ncbi:MAG: FtsQ-type POTRA domain-containing protein [Alphaproteobacteria bacterium]|nr:FtsQ-type POTRA domain-containing protein [Alphaproteobacteria bacterium]
MTRSKSPKGTRKASVDASRARRQKKAAGVLRLRTLVLWSAVFFVILGGFGVFLALEGSSFFRSALVKASVDAGLTVKTVSVEGRIYSNASDILGALDAEEGMPLLAFDPVAARENLEKLSWIKSAKVERRWPDTVYVDLSERVPLALWQKDKKLSLIDPDGVVITQDDLGRFSDLKIVTGDKAPQHAAEILALLRGEPLIEPKIEALSWTGDRRWNLQAKRGIIIKLPEDNLGFALGRLAKIEQENALLEKEVTQIDLRDPDEIIVRTKPGETQTYKVKFQGRDAGKSDI